MSLTVGPPAVREALRFLADLLELGSQVASASWSDEARL
jgi:hypothetical protein